MTSLLSLTKPSSKTENSSIVCRILVQPGRWRLIDFSSWLYSWRVNQKKSKRRIWESTLFRRAAASKQSTAHAQPRLRKTFLRSLLTKSWRETRPWKTSKANFSRSLKCLLPNLTPCSRWTSTRYYGQLNWHQTRHLSRPCAFKLEEVRLLSSWCYANTC